MAKQKGIAKNLIIGVAVTIIMIALLIFKIGFFETIENKLLDFRFLMRGAKAHSDAVVIAAIDEKSIDKLGRWPWSRDVLARLVTRLNDLGAELVVFDIILSEHERHDSVLADAIVKAGNVLLPEVFDFHKQAASVEHPAFIDSAIVSVEHAERYEKYAPIASQRALVPVEKLLNAAMGLGHINMFPDNDGTLRWETLLVAYNGYIFPSITLEAAARHLGVPHDRIIVDATENIKVGKNVTIPTDQWGRALINYYGPYFTFRHIPIIDILDGTAPAESVQDKIVLVGASAVGIYDLRVTPFSAAMPGVEKHASVITSIIEKSFLKKAPRWADLLILLIACVLTTYATSRLKGLGSVLAAILFLLVLLGGEYLAFKYAGFWLNLTYPGMGIIVITISMVTYHFTVEEAYARKVRAMFSSYVTEKLVSHLIENPEEARLGGERRQVTVLFSDIRGFTSLSEKHTPEQIVSQLNEYLSAMTDVVFRWDGILDKFIGDAIVAFWGAPMKQDDHAERAIRCALHMRARLGELQKKWAAEGKMELDNGIGINTGDAIVGNIGAEGRKMDYTVIGDAVNLGARLEGLTRKYDTSIIVSEYTLAKIEDIILSGKLGHLMAEGLENVIVKGKEQPVAIYSIKSIEPNLKSEIRKVASDEVVKLTEK